MNFWCMYNATNVARTVPPKRIATSLLNFIVLILMFLTIPKFIYLIISFIFVILNGYVNKTTKALLNQGYSVFNVVQIKRLWQNKKRL